MDTEIYTKALEQAKADWAAAEENRVALVRAWKNSGELTSTKPITKATNDVGALHAVIRSLTALLQRAAA